jgi:lipoprotein-releasing system permease protein
MGMETSITQGYPIKVKVLDFVSTMSVVSIVTLLISAYPSKLASRFATAGQL